MSYRYFQIYLFIKFQVHCKRDSGGAIIYEKSDKTYVIGILSQSMGEVKCKSPTKPTIGVTIPGKIFNWVKSKGSKAIEECLVKS